VSDSLKGTEEWQESVSDKKAFTYDLDGNLTATYLPPGGDTITDV
jgi:hypothetical protein